MRPTINEKLSREIEQKYAVINNTLRQTVRDNPADRITVEVGDVKQTDTFYPQVKINRWGDSDDTNEVNFSIRYKDDDYENAEVETEGEVIKWKKADREVHMYDKPDASSEGGFELELHLKEKPDTNVFDFTLQTKGLDFFYQPPLTPEEIADGASRPDNVIGSYAVYHKTGRNNRVGGKEYKTGKAFHIYRPHAVDAKGNETWCDLNINEETALLTVTIPQEFLDTAVYPVILDPTFGYTSAPATLYGNFKTEAFGNITNSHSASSGDVVTNYHFYGYSANGAGATVGMTTYAVSGSNFGARLAEETTVSLATSAQWNVSGTVSQALTGGTTYGVAVGHPQPTSGDQKAYIYYDSAGTNQQRLSSLSVSDPLPATWGTNDTGSADRYYGIYATYTASATAAPARRSLFFGM